MLKRVLYLFIAIVLPLLSFGQGDAGALFQKGNELYAKGQYKEALAAYQKVTDEGYQSAALYFNMGNANYKNDDIPSALLYYEKAHKLAPNDDDINVNIQLANLKTTDKIDAAPEFFLSRWWRLFIWGLPLSTLSVLSIIFMLIGSAALIAYFFAEVYSIKKASFYAAVAFFVMGLFTIFIANRQAAYFDGHKQAIVFSSSVTVKSGPGEKLNNLFVIHEGTKVNILGTDNDWVKISLANGNEGWIKAADEKEI
jgi:tetratricopeptide (TPR) repeat protein